MQDLLPGLVIVAIETRRRCVRTRATEAANAFEIRRGRRDESKAADRGARLHQEVARYTPILDWSEHAEEFEYMAAIIRQVAVGAVFKRREVEILRDAGISLLQAGIYVAFDIAIAMRPGVRALQEPYAVPRFFKEELDRVVLAIVVRQAEVLCRDL